MGTCCICADGGLEVEFPACGHLFDVEARRKVVVELLVEGKSLRDVAARTNLSKSTIERIKATVPAGTVPEVVTGLDGVERPAKTNGKLASGRVGAIRRAVTHLQDVPWSEVSFGDQWDALYELKAVRNDLDAAIERLEEQRPAPPDLGPAPDLPPGLEAVA